MADKKNKTTEQTPTASAPAAEDVSTPEAGGDVPEAPTVDEASRPASEADSPSADTPVAEPAAAEAEEPVADAAPAESVAAEEPAAAPAAEETAPAAPAPPKEPEVVLPPKERRAAKRAVKAAKVPTRAERSGEDRHADRVATRAKKAAERRTGRVKARAKASHEGAATTAPREHPDGTQKVRQGVVVSDKADKTITVRIDVARRHRRYKKIVRTSNTLHAHDETNDAKSGDTVIVRECRPLSRSKRWRLVQVVERAK